MSDTASGALSGAAQGAAAGSMIMPGIGTAVGAVLGAASSIFGSRSKRRAQKAAEAAAKRVAQAQNAMRLAKNDASIAAAELGRTAQGLNNARALRLGAKNEALARANLAAQQDAQSARTFEGRIQATERAGSLAAQAAVAGVAGGSFDAIQGVLALQNARREELAQRRADQQNADMMSVIGNQAEGNIAGLDIRSLLPTLDRSINSTHQGSQITGNSLSDIGKAVNDVGLKNIGFAAEELWKVIKPEVPTFQFDNDAGSTLPLQYQEKDV